MSTASAVDPDLATQRRMELAAFLRSRRAALDPSDLGLLSSGRRRTPGLRREEVAQLSGIGVTWYTWLEQGRPINVSESVLEAVARALKLDDGERTHLATLAGITVAPLQFKQCVDTALVQRMLDKLHPYPAMLVNDRYDVLAWNEAHLKLCDERWQRNDIAPGDRNILRWLFLSPESRDLFVNWEEETPNLVAVLRSNFAQHVGEPAWESFVADLCDRSAEFAELWQRHEIARPSIRSKVFVHKSLGILRFVTSSYRPISPMGTRVIVYMPDDESTAKAVESWA